MFSIRTASRLTVTAIATVAALGATATAAQAVEVDTTKMGQSIVSSMSSTSTGFAYAIEKDGKFAKAGDGGYGRPFPEQMTPDHRIELASVTKNVTAVAILKLLDFNNASPDTAIAPYLPAGWTVGKGFESVTFRHLLTHTSGVEQRSLSFTAAEKAQWTTLTDGVRFMVSKSTTPGQASSYTNMNYALLRTLLPKLWKQAVPLGAIDTSPNRSGDESLRYVNAMLSLANISPTHCSKPDDGSEALAFGFGGSGGTGGTYISLTGVNAQACAGHRGLHLSARELARFARNVASNNALLPAASRQLMDDGRLGWGQSSNRGTRVGMYWHGGDITLGGRGVHTCIMKTPGNVQAAIIVNSEGPNSDTCLVLRKAYDAAI